jgi:hypothetical protein
MAVNVSVIVIAMRPLLQLLKDVSLLHAMQPVLLLLLDMTNRLLVPLTTVNPCMRHFPAAACNAM